jgi:sigma-E factor negative regulatory protein RseC
MSQESGIVETVEDGWVWVKTQRKSACSHCGHKDHCHTIEGGDRMLVKAKNLAGAHKGDEVELYLNTKTQLKCVFMVYMVPVIGLLVGAFSGNSLSTLVGLSRNMGIFLFSVVGLAIAFVLMRLFSNRMETKNALILRVTRVVKRAPG